ncbi:hypothetical protein B0T13DRAFT_445364 [Neurospora crassa]|nr:hypothetical protein B0T13DRAFT_445364 [Neurospora crassa]
MKFIKRFALCSSGDSRQESKDRITKARAFILGNKWVIEVKLEAKEVTVTDPDEHELEAKINSKHIKSHATPATRKRVRQFNTDGRPFKSQEFVDPEDDDSEGDNPLKRLRSPSAAQHLRKRARTEANELPTPARPNLQDDPTGTS